MVHFEGTEQQAPQKLDLALTRPAYSVATTLGSEPVRILSLILSFLLTATLATATLIYLERHIGQQKIQVQGHWLTSPEGHAYRGYGR
jgi:hypothetical protein